ncbi:MAG: NAD(P)H-binding protein [Renibacterium sp.]|nr:NAD(P)H-binding protein [Renibacterium sp.]
MKNLANDFPVHPAAPTLLLGANGFIGSGIRRAFGQTRPSIPLRLAARQKIQPTAESSVAEVGLAPFDFRRTDLLAEAIRGAEAVIVATSYLGADQELSRAVNLDLVRTVIEISRESEIQRLVYVSTAAVHGRGPFRGSDLRRLGYAPTSFRSRDRAAADRMVLDAGGTVVRPQLILGAGDRWVMPGMSALLRALGGMPLAGAAKVSAIHVDRLGGLVAALAQHGSPGAYAAAELEPVSIAELARSFGERVGLELPAAPLALAAAREIAAGRRLGSSALEMLCHDSWFDASGTFEATGLNPAPREFFDPATADWYRGLLAG